MKAFAVWIAIVFAGISAGTAQAQTIDPVELPVVRQFLSGETILELRSLASFGAQSDISAVTNRYEDETSDLILSLDVANELGISTNRAFAAVRDAALRQQQELEAILRIVPSQSRGPIRHALNIAADLAREASNRLGGLGRR